MAIMMMLVWSWYPSVSQVGLYGNYDFRVISTSLKSSSLLRDFDCQSLKLITIFGHNYTFIIHAMHCNFSIQCGSIISLIKIISIDVFSHHIIDGRDIILA